MEMKIGTCSKIVALFNTWWTLMGWAFFAGSLLFAYFPGGIIPAILCFFLLIVWWIIDAIDQTVSGWQIALGIFMILASFLPRAGIIFIVAWVAYWFKIRE